MVLVGLLGAQPPEKIQSAAVPATWGEAMLVPEIVL
jgi:hypothetical protein